jgi:hypothetical protein
MIATAGITSRSSGRGFAPPLTGSVVRVFPLNGSPKCRES